MWIKRKPKSVTRIELSCYMLIKITSRYMEWSKLLESPEGKPITRTEWQAFIWHTSNQIINTRHKYLEWKLILDSANHCSSCVYISSNFKPILFTGLFESNQPACHCLQRRLSGQRKILERLIITNYFRSN